MNKRITRIQTLVSYVISNDQMPPSSNVLKEIAVSSDIKSIKQILDICYNQLKERAKPQKIWRSITLLRYLLVTEKI
jgi:hypothetical protein